MTLACFKRCFQVVFPNLVCFRVRFHTINLKHTHTKQKKIRNLQKQQKQFLSKGKTPITFPKLFSSTKYIHSTYHHGQTDMNLAGKNRRNFIDHKKYKNVVDNVTI